MGHEIPCTWCGKPFIPSRKDGLFHSAGCKQAYWRWKHRLNYLHSVANNALEEIYAYLEYPNKAKEAENTLGALADKLCILGFVSQDNGADETYEVAPDSNQL